MTPTARAETIQPGVTPFFFQAEDGIRDYKVTGVQTCALPIYNPIPKKLAAAAQRAVFQLVTGFPGSPLNGSGSENDFHPMKGPMTTQTLRGMVNEDRKSVV